jgi:ribosomal protein S18 acetylase RimI-like enzyme
VTAAAAVRASRTGLRPVDPRRDLSQLADVIEIAFADSLDPAGRRMAAEMRRYGRLGWLGWLVGHLFLPPAAYPHGYVWVNDGRVVANASLMPVQGAPERWVLANVAVDPKFRRRGIARSLVGACLDMARRRGVREVVLQVKSDNTGARRLYESFGFAARATRVTWRGARPGASTEIRGAVMARQRRPDEWQAHYDLARRLAPMGLVWPHPLRPGLFRPASWPGAEAWAHWVWPNEGPPRAALSTRMDAFGESQFYMLCEPSARGSAEQPLLERALAGYRRGGMTAVECDEGDSDDVLRRMGFREEHRLTWMTSGSSGAGPGLAA